MKFTIKPKPLITMLQMAGERQPRHKHGSAGVRLLACEGRVCVQAGNMALEAEALVWEGGQCRLSRLQLLQALKRHRDAETLTIEADARELRIEGISLPVSGFSPQATLPTSCQLVLATDLEVVPSQAVRGGGV